jgi:putative membrane protein
MKTYVKVLTVCVILGSTLIVRGFSQDLFFDKASQFHSVEIQAGKLAEIKGNPEVIKISRELVHYHTIANNELYKLAQQQGLKITDVTNAGQKNDLANLKELSGKAFDSAYMTSQFARYKQAIVLFTKESQTGINPEARAYAGKNLPKLQMHLQMFEGHKSAMKTTMDSVRKK